MTLENVESITIDDDLQRHRTRQTVIGSLPDAGQQRQFFDGDGVQREFILDFRIDQIVEVSLAGISQDFGGENDGYPWIVDPGRSTIRARAGNPAPPVGDKNFAVLYDYRGPILASRSDDLAVAAYGVIHNVLQDPAIETQKEANSVLTRELNRHSNPNININSRILFDEIPSIVLGNLAFRLTCLEVGIHNERWLIATVVQSSFGDGLVYDVGLVAEDYEELGEDYYRRQDRLTTPTSGTPAGRVVTGGGGSIDPNVLLHEGLRLPKPLGGYDFGFNSSDQWEPIPGAIIVTLDGLRLPDARIEYSFNGNG